MAAVQNLYALDDWMQEIKRKSRQLKITNPLDKKDASMIEERKSTALTKCTKLGIRRLWEVKEAE